ncbi:SRA stem-loop-interacting RNA-binding protein, mitochondrial-like [Monomorium pharaonis]|uniref:SRA stem-loop-interacting RNA-binding protein, mitochondrial-like n=1 Tax=Monomorium pharaonis TaxID=307658 RepID=UPI00063F781A|nr:SRA stem-loop-interacting RNA-binding protein, mitochondrial-like [Monomorium pharaonis]
MLTRYVIRVANIPWTVSRHELSLYFSQFGCVIDSYVAFDKQTGLHKGHGNIMFLKREQMQNVLEHKHSLEGKDLIVSIEKTGKIDTVQ